MVSPGVSTFSGSRSGRTNLPSCPWPLKGAIWGTIQANLHWDILIIMRNHIQLLGAITFSSLLVASCGDDGGVIDASPVDAPAPTGAFSLAWSLSDGNSAITCAKVAASSLSVSLVKQGGFGGMVDVFACSGGEATSRAFTPGTYDLTIDLRASGNRSLISAPVVIRDFEIVAGEVVAVPEQTFVVAPTGGFTFMADAQATAGNCDLTLDGAGILSLAFDLKDETNTCVPATYDVAAGTSGTATSYTNDCNAPPAFRGCLNADQLVTVNPIGSGPLVLTITGKKEGLFDEGPLDCYSRVSSFSVAGAMHVTDLGALPLALEYTLGCDANFVPPS